LWPRSLYYSSLSSFCSHRGVQPRDLPSFPTRRSSDLLTQWQFEQSTANKPRPHAVTETPVELTAHFQPGVAMMSDQADQMVCLIDRKSTRLNSSHVSISYAVFCLKKKISTSSRYITFD